MFCNDDWSGQVVCAPRASRCSNPSQVRCGHSFDFMRYYWPTNRQTTYIHSNVYDVYKWAYCGLAFYRIFTSVSTGRLFLHPFCAIYMILTGGPMSVCFCIVYRILTSGRSGRLFLHRLCATYMIFAGGPYGPLFLHCLSYCAFMQP